MKTFLISGVSALALASMAFAAPFEEADTDGDGRISLSEVQALDSATTEAEFTLYDVDLDGGLDEDEYAAWRVATQGDAEADYSTDPVMDDPMADDPMAEEDPVELEDVPADPYEPSAEKSLDDHGDKDEYGDEDREEGGEGDYSESDAAYGEGDVSHDDDADADEITEDLNEEQAEDLESDADEDGDENEPWK